MHSAESILDEDIRQGRELFGKSRIVGFFFRMVAKVFEEKNPPRRQFRGQCPETYSEVLENVSQLATSPLFSPVTNQRLRCSAEPCVNASGTT